MRRQFLRLMMSCSLAVCFYTGIAQADYVGNDRQSSFGLMSRETQAMQQDPTQNPATFWVLDGEALWNRPAGQNSVSCASCHGQAEKSMKGVAASFPKLVQNKLLNLEGQINLCTTQRQQSKPFAHESKELLSLLAFVGTQSKGMPITVDQSPAIEKHLQSGKNLFEQKMGQLNLSCAQCHAERAGKKLAGNPIPQGHPTGYPIYRLEWQSVGSLERRLRNCLTGVRAQPFADDSKEILELELYLMWRARGMDIETPAVRP
ncbi:sulfur oxidation c-type cytochrome SoxA [Orrella sp. NBD-18]|uniref:SoxAX cytochrome complex subunit A n=1 Tax=Sheuella amnicola TaxID=2707330 RepID=A0A6B2R3P8_9BURK|nr:sulfur oxidation c-type cytochrome SoxA [Sheuella amnicola]NDY84344.1 sulfur oxidation c-type cytochrome SoxA [Sheuella amnicola]